MSEGPRVLLATVLAGGQGSRFWPMSRASRPKQFLSISESGESLIQATVRRIRPLVSDDQVWVLANPELLPLILEHVPQAKVICEPVARNTAACIGLAAVHALIEYPGVDPVMIVLPADHAIRDEGALREALQEAAEVAFKEDALVTIGIPPTHPHTGYGYIKRGPVLASRTGGRTHRVERFFEKPNLDRARKYVESGDFSWNSGMFVWRASVILNGFKAYLPAMYEALLEIKRLIVAGEPVDKINELFSEFESISIDFGVLEHARNCLVVNAQEFGWNDVGSWDQWAENFAADADGNLIKGDAVVIDSQRCVLKSETRLLAAVGLKDVIIIDTGDALLVVGRDSVQDVRKVVQELKSRRRLDLV